MWYLVLCGALVMSWSSGYVMVTRTVVMGIYGDGLGRQCQWNWEAVTLLGLVCEVLVGTLRGIFTWPLTSLLRSLNLNVVSIVG